MGESTDVADAPQSVGGPDSEGFLELCERYFSLTQRRSALLQAISEAASGERELDQLSAALEHDDLERQVLIVRIQAGGRTAA